MEFYLILGNTKAMVFNWEGGGGLRLNGKGGKEYRPLVVKRQKLPNN